MTEYKQLERLNYFHSKLLTAADFQHEQEYQLERSRRNNRLLHGWGVVRGLRASIAHGDTLVVTPGFALDCAGNELVLAAPEKISLAGLTGKHFVTIQYEETQVAPYPMIDEEIAFGRIHEGVRIELACVNPAEDHQGLLAGTPGCGQTHAICLATLGQRDANWRVTSVKRSLLPGKRR